MLIFNLTIACVGRVILGMQRRHSDLNAQAVNINRKTSNFRRLSVFQRLYKGWRPSILVGQFKFEWRL